MGFQEMRLAQGADAEPAALTLEAIEQGVEVDNAHVILSEYIGVTDELIYYCTTSKYSQEIKETTKVDYTYTPLVSENHPFINKFIEVLNKYPEGEEVPESEYPKLNEFTVLLKSKRYETVADLPYEYLQDETAQGIFINKIESLDGEELNLLQGSFPDLDFDQVLILEEGREPASAGSFIGMMAGGVVLSILGLIWFFAGFVSKEG